MKDELVELAVETDPGHEALDLSLEAPSRIDGEVAEPEIPDPSGLTHDQKVEQILISYRDFQNSLTEGGREQVVAENILATRCAVTIMRESGRAIYELDVDDGERRAFRMSPPSPDTAFVAADNAKYLIDLNEFAAVRLSRERNALIGRGRANEIIPTLQENELAQYENIVQQAYKALGVSHK